MSSKKSLWAVFLVTFMCRPGRYAAHYQAIQNKAGTARPYKTTPPPASAAVPGGYRKQPESCGYRQ